MSFHVPNQFRATSGPYASTSADGNNGAFYLPAGRASRKLIIIASDGEGWEHVSVRAVEGKDSATPTWAEMCYAKGVFWDDEDAVVQFHPRKSQYVNNHANVLHLWRPTFTQLPEPHSLLVGYKEVGTIAGTREEEPAS